MALKTISFLFFNVTNIYKFRKKGITRNIPVKILSDIISDAAKTGKICHILECLWTNIEYYSRSQSKDKIQS